MIDIAYRGLELAAEFLPPRPCPRGFGGRRWQELEELEQGYALVALLDNSTIMFLFRSPCLSRSQTLPERALFGRGLLLRCRVSSR